MITVVTNLILGIVFLVPIILTNVPPVNAQPVAPLWLHLSTAYGDLEVPGASTQQTASLVLDIDGDTRNDFVVAARRNGGPAIVWYRRDANGWTRHVVEHEVMDIEAGGAYADIDRDGDLDLVFGGDQRSNQVWWWENPAPNFDAASGWTRREIKNSGGGRHHDLIFGDFDGDGSLELVFWNQSAKTLWLAEIPDNPHADQPWQHAAIFTWQNGDVFEGLAAGDIDGDGLEDIVGGGRWFKYQGEQDYVAHVIDDAQRYTRAAVGQLVAGGPPEVVFGAGDTAGALRWYAYDGSTWVGHDLLEGEAGYSQRTSGQIDHGHSLAVADVNGDGFLDIFAAEMRLDGNNPDAAMWLLLGDGTGNFTPTLIATGYDNHESTVADLDGDGDLDILAKPYNHGTPRIDIWLNQTICQTSGQHWQRRVVDADAPWRTLFIDAADLDGDGRLDISTGGWWYSRSGTPAEPWTRHTFGAPLHNMAALHDFDQDGDIDVFGSQWQGEEAEPALAWARNEGDGIFTPLTNLAAGEGDFLQGVAVGQWQPGQTEIALSWHHSSGGVQSVVIPTDPITSEWPLSTLSPVAQNEALSPGDIDRDGRVDLLLGTQWLHNLPQQAGVVASGALQINWQPFTLTVQSAHPDRNRLADINQDGRLDAVMGYEAINEAGMLAWYAQPEDATALWAEYPIATLTGPMSLSVADMDGDGDLDVVVGEHFPKSPTTAALFWFENVDGFGGAWQQHLIYRGDEHHDGAVTVDIDADGDVDILSIGWTHRQVLLYENVQSACEQIEPTATATFTPIQAIDSTSTPLATGSATATAAPSQTAELDETLTPTATGTSDGGAPDGAPSTPTPTQSAVGAISGRIHTLQDSQPIPVQTELLVVLNKNQPAVSPLKFAVATDGQGSYRVEEVPAGDYWLTVVPARDFHPSEPLQLTVVANSMVEVNQIVHPISDIRIFLPAVSKP